jgi:parallel beta-helix repeat protein
MLGWLGMKIEQGIKLFIVSVAFFLLCVNSQTTTTNNTEAAEQVQVSPIGVHAAAGFDDVNITTDTTWSTDMNLTRGVVIEEDATLVIENCYLRLNEANYSSCTIEIQNGGTLVVRQGATLDTYNDTVVMYSINFLSYSAGNMTDSTINRCYNIDVRSTQGMPFSSDILFYNNTFYDWGNYLDGMIVGNYADRINITGNDFCNPDHDSIATIRLTEAQNATIADNTFHDYSLPNATTWAFSTRNIIQFSQDSVDGPIHSTITGNTFRNLGIASHEAFHCIFVGPPNVEISNNIFENIHGYGIKGQVANCTIQSNVFKNMTGTGRILDDEYYPSGAIYLYGSAAYNTIEGNFIEDVAGPGIWARWAFYNTLSENALASCGEAGIRLSDDSRASFNNTLFGNIFVGNALGVEILDLGANTTTYQNIFLMNALSAADQGNDNNAWNNATWGNLWYGGYSGTDGDNDWIGDSQYDLDANITDYYPAYRVGDLPPGSGQWSVSRPLGFLEHSITVPGDIVLTGTASALILLDLDVDMNKASTTYFEIPENAGAYLGGASVTLTGMFRIDSYGEFNVHNSAFSGNPIRIDMHGGTTEFMSSTVTGGTTYFYNCVDFRVENSAFDGQVSIETGSDGGLFDHCNLTQLTTSSGANGFRFEFCDFSDYVIVGLSDYYTFYQCTFGTGYVQIDRADHVTFNHCEFSGYGPIVAQPDMVDVYASDWFNFTYNTIVNTTAGLDFGGTCTYAEISYNDFTMISGVAIDFLMSAVGNNFNVTHNAFDGCTAAIQAEGSSAIVTWNQITNCNSLAIDVDGNGGTATIENNVVECSGSYGIWAQYLSGTTIANNVISGGTLWGMYLDSFNNGMLQNNTITETTDSAIRITGSSSGTDVYDNYIMHNDGWGLYVDGNLDTIWYNSFWENDDGNIYIGSGGSVNALDNGVYGNFWGPSGPDGQDYYSGPDSATDWVGGGTYDVYYFSTLKAQDNYPLLLNDRSLMAYPTTVSGVPLYVAQDIIVLAENVTVQYGIRIIDGFTLTFVGTHVDFDNSTSVPQKIEVQTGGTLMLLGGTTFTSDDSQTYELGLQTGAVFYVDNATIESIGYGAVHTGLYLNVSTVTILNLQVGITSSGIILDGVTGLYMENITVYSSTTGIQILDSDNVHINHGYMSWITGTGIEVSTSSYDNLIEYMQFNYCGSCVNLTGASDNSTVRYCEFWNSDLGIHVDSTVTNSRVYFNMFATSVDFYVEDAGSTTAYNNGTHGNWYEDYPGEDNDGDLLGDTSYDNPVASDIVDTRPLVIWGAYPTASGWQITQDTVVLHTNYTMKGDLIVNEGYNLIIRGGTIWFDCAYVLQHEVGVYGYLEMHDNALRAVNISYMFDFGAYDSGSLYIRNLYASGMYRFRIHTSNSDIQSVILEDTHEGFHIAGTASAHLNSITLSDIVVNRSAFCGIYVVYTDGLNLYTVKFQNVTQGFRSEFVTDITIDTIESIDCSYGLFIRETTNLSVSNAVIHPATTGIQIQNPFYGTLTCTNVEIVGASTYGMYLFMSGDYGVDVSLTNVNVTNSGLDSIVIHRVDTCTITDCVTTMDGTNGGFYLSRIDWIEMENTTMYHSEQGVWLVNSNGLLTDCEFWNVTSGIYAEYTLTGYNVTVADCEFQSGTSDIYLVDLGNNRINITNNEFWYGSWAVREAKTDMFEFSYNQVWYQNRGVHITGGSNPVIHHNEYHSVDTPIDFTSGGFGGNVSFETINDAETAIRLITVDDVTVRNCSITVADYGVYINGCYNLTIYGLEIEALNSAGVYLGSSEAVNMTYCTIGGGLKAIMYGVAAEAEADHHIDTTNLYDGKPIYYIFNETSTQHSSLDTNHLAIFFCDDVTLVDSTVATDGVYLGYCTGCTFVNSSLGRAIELNSVADILFIGNEFPIFGTTVARYNFATNVTFTRNAFLDYYTFSQTGYNLNGSDHIGNYWYNYAGDDANYDGIGDTPHVTNTMNDYHPLMVEPRSVLAVVEILSPADGSVVGTSVLVRLNVTVIPGIYYTGDSVAVTNVQVGSTIYPGGSTGIIEVTVLLSEGENTIRAYSTVDLIHGFEATINVIADSTGPLVEIDVEDGFATASSSPQPAGDFSDANTIVWIAAVVNGTVQENATTSSSTINSYHFTLTLDSDGAYTVSFLAMDEAGNLGNVTLNMYRDTADPVISSSPSPIEYIEGTTGHTLTIEASDLTPSHYNVSLDGTIIQNSDWNGSNVVLSIDGYSVGTHTIEVVFHDRTGHSAIYTATVTVTGAASTTATTTTTTTATTTTTSTPPPGIGNPMILIAILGGIGGAVLVVVIIVYLRRRPSV